MRCVPDAPAPAATTLRRRTAPARLRCCPSTGCRECPGSRRRGRTEHTSSPPWVLCPGGTVAAIPRIRVLSCLLLIPTAFGSPVVPLVNRTSASRSSVSSAVFAGGIGLSLNRSAAVNTLLAPAARSRSTYASPAIATSAHPAFCIRPRSSGGVSAGFISAAAAPMRAAPKTDAMESRLPPSTTATRVPAATPLAARPAAHRSDGRRQLAVADAALADDERDAVGITGSGGVDDHADAHPRLNTGVTTRRCEAAGWSIGRADPMRRTSRFPVRGSPVGSRSEGG